MLRPAPSELASPVYEASSTSLCSQGAQAPPPGAKVGGKPQSWREAVRVQQHCLKEPGCQHWPWLSTDALHDCTSARELEESRRAAEKLENELCGAVAQLLRLAAVASVGACFLQTSVKSTRGA